MASRTKWDLRRAAPGWSLAPAIVVALSGAPARAADSADPGAPFAGDVALAGDTDSDGQSARPPAFGDPLPGLDAALLDRFFRGRVAFDRIRNPGDGLGPVFNDTSCTACHGQPAVGGSSPRNVTRFGRLTPGAPGSPPTFDPLAGLGGSLAQARGIGRFADCNYVGEIVPPQANVATQRRTTPLFGLGLVDAVPDATLDQIARDELTRNPATAGRTNRVTEVATGAVRVGRFGWKAQVPTLLQFAGDAYLNEMGITNPAFPDESCPQGNCGLLRCNPRPGLNDDGTDTQRLADFMILLASPPPGPISPQAAAGANAFKTAGCTDCHLPSIATGPHPVPALDRVAFRPYSDFLLHDMGPLGDGITQGLAGGRDIRTAPLWGVSRQPTLLHDGRARTLDQAIQEHDGQAAGSRDRYRALRELDRRALIDFLASL